MAQLLAGCVASEGSWVSLWPTWRGPKYTEAKDGSAQQSFLLHPLSWALLSQRPTP